MSEPVLIQQAYRYALAPTRAQEEFLGSCAGASRFWFNQGLALVKERLEMRVAEGDSPVTSVPWSYKALCSEIEQGRRRELAPWQGEVVCGSYQAGFEALGKALQNFSKARKAGRKGGFPRFRAKGRSHESIIFQRPQLFGARHVGLDKSRLGPVRCKERLTKLQRLLERDPNARVLRSTVQKHGRTWFISFTVERSPKQRRARRPDDAVGVDVGLSRLATLSTGEYARNSRPLQGALGKLARYQRQLDRQRRANNPLNYNSNGTVKPGRRDWVISARMRQTQERVQRLHERVANLRRHQAHELTTMLTREYGGIGVETIAVGNLMCNKRLARHIADVGWGTILRQLQYKAGWTESSMLVAADRFYPSSKTCSKCGSVKAKLGVSERVYDCHEPECGLVMDRDLNAARNLAELAQVEAAREDRQTVVAAIGAETLNARGGQVRLGRLVELSPAKREVSVVQEAPQRREALVTAA